MPGCKANASSMLKVLMSSLSTLHNVFPVRNAGYPIFNF
jgi:hypothetical protein